MADTDVELVIKIPKTLISELDDDNYQSVISWYDTTLYCAIKDGLALPKGHGKLIDADELYGDFIDGTEGYDCQTWNRIEIGDIIEDAHTVIEADKEDNKKMAELISSETIVYFGKECHTPKSKKIIRAFDETSHDEKNTEQAIINLVIRAYESGYNEGSLNTVKTFVRDADKAPDISMQTYFEAYKKQLETMK